MYAQVLYRIFGLLPWIVGIEPNSTCRHADIENRLRLGPIAAEITRRAD